MPAMTRTMHAPRPGIARRRRRVRWHQSNDARAEARFGPPPRRGGCACGGGCPTCRAAEEGTVAGPPTAKTKPDPTEDLQSAKLAGNARLQRAFDNDPALGIGESGEAVRLVQEELVRNGFPMPKSTREDGEMDGAFGMETFTVLQQFQELHELAVDGIAGRETLGRLDQLAQGGTPPERKPKVPGQKPVPKPKPKPAETGCKLALEDKFFGPSGCGNLCGGGNIIEWVRVRAQGQGCPKDLSGMKLTESVSVIENTCPEARLVTGLGCVTDASGRLLFEGGPCLDRYRSCFSRERFCGGLDPFDCASFLTPSRCDLKVRQNLSLNGTQVKSRTIHITVLFEMGDPFADPRGPDFIRCFGTESHTP
jgi:hypothetical protein